jgi:hypothetical protein
MTTAADSEKFAEAVDRLVDEYRARCLWFLREDYYPTTTEERLRVLGYIQRHGDLAAFRRASELRKCLLPDSSGRSAV